MTKIVFEMIALRFEQQSTPQSPPLNLPQLQIAGIPIPQNLENRGFFMFGSPGTGKTQAISQMTARIRHRKDFRAIIFDRNGEMVEKFYRPEQDLIFNPFDARSVGWSHVFENMRPETMAAGLIPHDPKYAYFTDAGKAVLSELFRLSKNNEEFWSLMTKDYEALASFLAGTFAATYLKEERSAVSVLTTILNRTQFYPSLPSNKESLSFFDWGSSDDSRWIFITLRESDTEILRLLHTLVFELMLQGLLSNEGRDLKTAIIIDELGALNQLPSLHRLLSESRKYLGCPILGTQTKSQITKIYSLEDTSTILQGTKTKFILNCTDPETAKAMADIIGKQEYIHTAENHSRSRQRGKFGDSKTVAFNQQLRERHAVMPDDITALPDLVGYLKIAQHCTKATVTYTKFPPQNPRFVSVVDPTSEQIEPPLEQNKLDSPSEQNKLDIKQQWQSIQKHQSNP